MREREPIEKNSSPFPFPLFSLRSARVLFQYFLKKNALFPRGEGVGDDGGCRERRERDVGRKGDHRFFLNAFFRDRWSKQAMRFLLLLSAVVSSRPHGPSFLCLFAGSSSKKARGRVEQQEEGDEVEMGAFLSLFSLSASLLFRREAKK